MAKSPPRTRPGLVKAGPGPLVRRRQLDLVAAEDGPVRAMVEGADIVSEGMPQTEGDGIVYYGSTSVLLLARSRGGTLPDPDLASMAALLACDPHLKLRVLRIARREACTRVQGELGPVRAEIDVRASAAGVVVLVDVVAVVHASAASGASR
ncbi:hypothetical protein [Polyangium mundeleinium]|uniref:Uncharacterized protein n=1 Tax=Polyangium mundeleinium TaxID=2995306 RepID=A0ABT5EU01_9BACT|nr:hypothetical protein [Polyangium mundeleinium]MDC0745306.1 hypothetical protein [Polyangium mundeleinium]